MCDLGINGFKLSYQLGSTGALWNFVNNLFVDCLYLVLFTDQVLFVKIYPRHMNIQ